MRCIYRYLAAAAVPLALAAPVPAPAPFPQPGLTNPVTGLLTSRTDGAPDAGSILFAIPNVLTDLAAVKTAATTVQQAIANGTVSGIDVPVLVRKLFAAVKPTATPTSIPQAQALVASVVEATNTDTPRPAWASMLVNGLTLVLNGFTSSDIEAVAFGANPYLNAANNNNPPVPVSKRFYNRVKGDAPFSVSEDTLRAAIYIPPGFTWGKKQPVIMSPGTGSYGYIAFRSNIGKLLAQTNYADPVYLNIPGALLGDAQVHAEYVSYALQYFNVMTGKKPAIVTWSQGALNAQWEFKYWPSIRANVTDHVAVSPDYHGSVLAYIPCPGIAAVNVIGCTPAVLQQTYQSNFVNTLRSNGGDSAYVPTTTVYSLTDEIVQPQMGTAASGFLQDARGVGVSNTYLQGSCAGLPAGGVYTHEGVLVNPVTYALITDALKHTGPGSFDRVSTQCANIVAPGISLSDVIETESLIPLALLNILSYLPKVVNEPAIKGYAVSNLA